MEAQSSEDAAVPNEVTQFRVPTTLRQFSKDYRELERLPPENFAKYFLSIPTTIYSSLFGELMETEMVSRLIRGLIKLLESSSVTAAEVSECLLHLADVPRFELLVMFLGDDEKKDLASICLHLTESDAVFIREKYHLEDE
ncbi:hypothetical protein Y032_0357g3383 [Ancylostoma ceylanicum]|uniref:RNA-polymerase II-associated protein 3-like C-terminal domain-containing protein n=1 Tax=Ancylostoma ceylanicum TaxID=53326 RepID=A0A016RX80_9BILA|nr:hypothetical protein Y032_0357g3383 [Ancylostoma ceylanicum]